MIGEQLISKSGRNREPSLALRLRVPACALSVEAQAPSETQNAEPRAPLKGRARILCASGGSVRALGALGQGGGGRSR